MQIKVKTLAGMRALLDVQHSDTIETMKAMIQEKWGADRATIQLIHAGKTLDINKPLQTLADCGIKDGDTIYLGKRSLSNSDSILTDTLVYRFHGGAIP